MFKLHLRMMSALRSGLSRISLRPSVPSSLLPFFLSLLPILTTGCCPCQRPEERPLANVKTEPMAAVVEKINANNSRVPHFWAHHAYEADIVDEKGQNHHAAGLGYLNYSSPNSLRLVAEAAGIGTLFEIGSNPKTYWLKLAPQAGDTFWWGRYEDLEHINPDQIGIPIRPDLVLDVLAVSSINTNFNLLPAPTMRFVPEGDAYVFTWISKLPDRWVALREAWYDRQTLRPRLVLLYDLNGRVVLRGKLSQYRQLMVEGVPKANWPWIPGQYNLLFPDSGSKLGITMDQAELQHREDDTVLPNAKTFRMPNPEGSGAGRVNQIGARNGNSD